MVTGFGDLTEILFGSTDTRVSHFEATANSPPDLGINIAAGWILSEGPIDETDCGALPADETAVMRLGYSEAVSKLLDIGDLSAGQNKWALVYAGFTVVDSIRQGDPDNGIPKFLDSANPTVALEGQGGSGLPNDTVRSYVADVEVIYGAPAATGTELPPFAPAGAAPMYLINLTHLQPSITQGDIKVAGPGVGANTSGYPVAPFAAGLYTQHHKGGAGQAPQIDLATEVQGILGFVNMPTTGTVRIARITGGTADPNGTVGDKWDLYIQIVGTDRILWECEADAGTVWKTIKAGAAGGGTTPPTLISSFPGTIAGSGNYICTASVDSNVALPQATGDYDVSVARNDGVNTAIVTLLPHSGDTINGLPSFPLVKGNDAVHLISDTATNWVVMSQFLGE